MVTDEKLKITKVVSTDGTKLVVIGTIDEDTNFDALSKIAGPVTVNFKGLVSINSCGVRKWINFLRTISNHAIFLEECPPLIVRQINMIPGVLGNAAVKSVYATYVCDKCNREKLVLVRKEEFTAQKMQVPQTLHCDTCKNGEMGFDGRLEKYFARIR